jgi:hypothetical protein
MIKGTAVSYRVFVRNWWRKAGPGDPQNYFREGVAVVPGPGPKTTIAMNCTEAQAREICASYSLANAPGPLSRKAEYERE